MTAGRGENSTQRGLSLGALRLRRVKVCSLGILVFSTWLLPVGLSLVCIGVSGNVVSCGKIRSGCGPRRGVCYVRQRSDMLLEFTTTCSRPRPGWWADDLRQSSRRLPRLQGHVDLRECWRTFLELGGGQWPSWQCASQLQDRWQSNGKIEPVGFVVSMITLRGRRRYSGDIV